MLREIRCRVLADGETDRTRRRNVAGVGAPEPAGAYPNPRISGMHPFENTTKRLYSTTFMKYFCALFDRPQHLSI
jgi:hypothetical protein